MDRKQFGIWRTKKDIGRQWLGECKVILIQDDGSTSESISSPRCSMKYLESLNSLPLPGLFHTQIAAHSVIWKQMTDTLETQSEVG